MACFPNQNDSRSYPQIEDDLKLLLYKKNDLVIVILQCLGNHYYHESIY